MKILLTLLCFLFSQVIIANDNTSDIIADEYFVVLQPEFTTQGFIESKFIDEKIISTFQIINAVLVSTSDPMSLQRRGVAYIEPNRRVSINTEYQNDASWGIDRIDSYKGLDGTYKYDYTGAGVHVYVVDTGVLKNHIEYADRLQPGYSAYGTDTNDCNGHGTHVAGTIGGNIYGVAKDVMIYPVRVLDCRGNGTMDGIIKGVEWIINNVKYPAVVNMSLGGGKTQSLNDAIKVGLRKNIHFALAAGNESSNACNTSPASVVEAITVAASDRNDVSASFTNYGRCVDIYAPGVNITSAGIGSDKDVTVLSGTSMATPHVAGVMSLMLEAEPDLTYEQLAEKIIANGSKKVISKVPLATPNIMLRSPLIAQEPDPEPEPDPENPQIPVEPYLPCKNENILRSSIIGLPLTLSVINDLSESVYIVWIDPWGNKKPLGGIAPNATSKYTTRTGARFIVVNEKGNRCIGTWRANVLNREWLLK